MCPECEGLDSRVKATGRDAMGQVIRLRVCSDCGPPTVRFTTVEVVVPEVSFYQLNESMRLYGKFYNRHRFGYRAKSARRSGWWVRASVRVVEEPAA